MPAIPSGDELLNPTAVLERAGIRTGMQVADLGCGSLGHFVFPAARLVGPSGAVYAVDILKSALSGIESRRKIEGVGNVKPLWADIEVLGATAIPTASLDLVMLVNNLPKLPMMREAARLVKPGGRLLAVDWKPAGASFGPPSSARVGPGQMTELAAASGLHPLEVFEAGEYHYGIVFDKK